VADGMTEGEKEFRDAYGDDPAGAVFDIVSRLQNQVVELQRRVVELEMSLSLHDSVLRENFASRMSELDRERKLDRVISELSSKE